MATRSEGDAGRRFVLPARVDGVGVQDWELVVTTVAAHRSYFIACPAPDGSTLSVEGTDVFSCLLDLRRQLEARGVWLCCNGSRRDAWASGMQRDMGRGMSVYLLEGVEKGVRPPQVRTLDAALCEHVVSVEDQIAWYDSWLGAK